MLDRDVQNEVLDRISAGESVRSISARDGMPSMTTVFRWLREDEIFRQQYARAKEIQAEYLADEILDIADDSTNDWMEEHDKRTGEAIGWRENGDSVRRSVLRVDARKWVAAKLLPKKYGDRLTHQGDAENPIVQRVIKADL